MTDPNAPIPISAEEAIMRIREGLHAEVSSTDAITNEVLIGALERGYIAAALDAYGRLCFTRS